MHISPTTPLRLGACVLAMLTLRFAIPTAGAAPIITATKDDNLAAGLRKFPGNTITYSTTISNTGDATATAVQFADPDPANTTFVSVNSTPIARNDTYGAIGNVQITIPAATGVLANDNDPDDSVNGVAALTASAGATSANGGNVSLAANGGFTYNPAPGFTGADTFTYTLTDTEGSTDTGTVTINVTGMIWFINAAAGAGGDGRLTAPFNTLTALGASPLDEAGDNVFLYTGTYNGAHTLLNLQRLIGAGGTQSLQTITGLTPPTGSLAFPATGGTRPLISAASPGNALQLGSGNGVHGVNVTNTNGNAILGIGVGTLILADFDATATNGSALNLSSGGTVTATGTDNDLSATTGTALNVVSVNIGAAGLTFKSISSGNNTAAADPASGIILSGTGTAGGLTVTGTDGADAGTVPDAGTGGTIQSCTSHGVSLTTTENVRLGGMNIINNLGSGISGSTINGFLLDGVTISGNGNDAATDESGINVTAVTGSAFAGARPTGITNSTISNNNEFEVQITNTAGTLTDFRLTNNTISSNGLPINGNASSPHGNLVNFLGLGTAIMTLNASGGNFTGNWNPASPPATITATGLQADHSGTSGTMTANISGATFTNNNVGPQASVAGGAQVIFNFLNNSVQGSRSSGINFFADANPPFTKSMTGTVSGNTIGTLGVTGSGAQLGFPIRVQNEGRIPMTIAITNNTVQESQNFTGININFGITLQAGTGPGNFTITGNTIREIDSGRAILVQQLDHLPAGGNAGTVNVNISGNVISNVAGQAGDGTWIRIRRSDNSVTKDFNVTQLAATGAAIANELDDANGFNNTARISVGGTPDYGQPAPPLPLLFASGGIEAEHDLPAAASDQVGVQPAVSGILPESSEQIAAIRDTVRALTQSELDSLVASALDRWTATGLTGEQLATLRRLQFEVADLPGWYLGEAAGDRIRVDNNAGGNGWFIGAAAEDDALFLPNEAISATRRYTDPASAPAGRIDLLTAILHEMGHALGLDDTYAEQDRDSLMYGFLTKGERRLPAKDQAAGATPHAEAHPHFLGTPLTIGDLPPGKTVTITYVVTINAGTTAISTSSQGTVTGTNIAAKVTNDPQTGTADDATVTPIHQPPVVSNVTVGVNEDNILTFAGANFTGSYSDPNGDSLSIVRITSLPANGVLKVGATTVTTVPTNVAFASINTLTFTPSLDYNGPASFGWTASDGVLFAVAGATVNITVNPVNDKPTFTAANPPAVNEDALAQTVMGWVTNFNPGPANESGQTALAYPVSNVSNPALFSAGPSVAANGTLTYTPAANANGTSTFQVRVQDSGGTANGGVEFSDLQTFTITVNPVNDAPAITGQNTVTTPEETARTIVFADLLVTDVDNTYPTGFTLSVSNGTNYTRVGNAITPVLNFVGTLTVPVKVNDGALDSNTFSLSVTVTNTNDAPQITGQNSVATTEGTPRTIVLGDLLVTDVDNAYPAGFTLTVSNGANYTRFGNTITPTAGFLGTLTVPVQVTDGALPSNTFNLSVTVGTSSSGIAKEAGGGYRISFKGNPGVTYTIQYTSDLVPAPIAWVFLGTATADGSGNYSIVDNPPVGTPKRFYRSVLPYTNNFNAGLGAATLLGTAVLDTQAVRLTETLGGQVGAVVFEGMAASPVLGGFTAKFTATLGPTTTITPADGMSFAVGNLGAVAWGEGGPVTANSLAVGFDTFSNGPVNDNAGIHVWVNGTHLAVSPVVPYAGGPAVTVPVEISYDVATGLTVKYNSVSIFTNLAIPGFAFPASGGKFGIGARTGGNNERAAADDVEITPR